MEFPQGKAEWDEECDFGLSLKKTVCFIWIEFLHFNTPPMDPEVGCNWSCTCGECTTIASRDKGCIPHRKQKSILAMALLMVGVTICVSPSQLFSSVNSKLVYTLNIHVQRIRNLIQLSYWVFINFKAQQLISFFIVNILQEM